MASPVRGHSTPKWSAVAEVAGEFANAGPGTNASLTLASYLGGVRYQLPRARKLYNLEPFAQVLVGAAHAGGGIAGAGDGTTEFMTRMGGAIDLPISHRFAIRIIQVDYDLTTFANGVNDRQNNLLVAAGVVYHWPR